MPPTNIVWGQKPSKPDPNNQRFMMARGLAELTEIFPTGLPEGTRHYRTGPHLDQGSTGTCVAHGGTTRLNSAPVMQKLFNLTPFDLYRKIVLVDEWTDNDYEATAPDIQLQSGTSVHALMKTLKALGYIKNYLWAENVDNVRNWHLAGLGGTVIGVTWKADMMDTDSDGFVNFTGTAEGGHCVSTCGWNDRVKHRGRIVRAMRCQQSWELPWGDHGSGFFWISEDDLAKMIDDDGEIAAPTEIRLKAA